MLKAKIITDHPVAYESHDHLVPCGTVNDNTKHDAYVDELIGKFGYQMRYMDLGCAGGGFVAQFLERGVFAVGLEGSDVNLKTKRAEWANYPDNLFTCDLCKPFKVVEESTDRLIKFDAISMFDVLEHIPETDLPQLIKSINMHLRMDGIFIASIAEFPHEGYHVTLKPEPWWTEKFGQYGFLKYPDLWNYGRGSSFNVTYRKVFDA